MDKTRHGVIGLGWFGEKHLEALVGNPGAEIYALCTRNNERLSEIAGRFQPRKTWTDYREMLEDSQLDSVSITTMWDQHRAPAVAALEAVRACLAAEESARTGEVVRLA